MMDAELMRTPCILAFHVRDPSRSTHGCVQRGSRARKEVGTPKDAELYSRSAMRQLQILKAVQAESPFCWQPLPEGCAGH
jgi:hypothetical protein